MSAYDLQKVTALLIRRPESYRGAELEGFLNQFELTTHERYQATALANDPKVAKYGRIMGGAREAKVTNLLRQSKYYLHENLLPKIWKEYFEPQAIYTTFNQLPQAFLQFLINNQDARRVIEQEAPPFIPDMLTFEMAMAHFRLKHYLDETHLPVGSLLKHLDFVVLSLEWDIQGLRAKLIKGDVKPGEVAPDQRKVHLLFVRKGTSWESRVFEIDGQTYEFVQGQKTDPKAATALPGSFSTLVELGLCREVN